MAVRGGKREQRGERQKEIPVVKGEMRVNPLFYDVLRAMKRPYS